MRAFVEKFLSRPPPLPREQDLVVLTGRVPVGERRLGLEGAGDSLVWEPGRTEGTERTAPHAFEWALSGRGESKRIEARGQDRWSSIEKSAAQAWSSIGEWREPGCEAPPTRLFGGGSFQPSGGEFGDDAEAGRPGDPAWAGFGDASFLLPRWLHGRRDDQAFLQFAFHRSELEGRSRLLEEVDWTLAALGGHDAVTLSRPSSPPVDTKADDGAFASWCDLVGGALDGIRAHAFEKVVAARRTYVPFDSKGGPNGDPSRVLERLRADNVGCTCFAFCRGDKMFFGASPERLVVADGCDVFTEALAGSKARSGGADSTEFVALLASEKDRREHALVVDGIARALAPFGGTIQMPVQPSVRTLRRIHHLLTPITLRLDAPTHALSLVAALHPTPAVCGFPRRPAFDWIASHERFDRGWYAGPVGWFDREGRGSFAVAIRSALLDAEGVWVFAGAGIVERSDPSAEYAETALKQKTILSALGLTA